MSNWDIINGSLDAVVAAWRKHVSPTTTQICRVGGCVFTQGHTIKHSWEYTQQ